MVLNADHLQPDGSPTDAIASVIARSAKCFLLLKCTEVPSAASIDPPNFSSAVTFKRENLRMFGNRYEFRIMKNVMWFAKNPHP